MSWRDVGSSARVGMSVLYMVSLVRNQGRTGNEKAGQLIADQHEAGGHHDGVGGVGVAPEAVGAAPVAHRDEDGGERQQLADLDADIEGEQVRHQAVRRDL